MTRRPVLLGLAGAALLTPLVGVLAGCGSDADAPLRGLAERALADAVAIDRARAGGSVKPALASVLGQLAGARRAHAQAVAVAIGESDTSGMAQPSSTPEPGDSGDPVAEVRDALDAAQREAGRLVLTLPRVQAGLVGSIAACCAAYRSVLQ